MSAHSLPLQRVLIVAPHPDDEAIATGGLIQQTLADGGAVRVVFLTDGERNVWPQRAMLRKWRISAADRAAWGALRRREALASLAILGASESDAAFLGFPDGGLNILAAVGDPRIADALSALVRSFGPTLMVSPSSFDLHSDHRAAALFAHRAAGEVPVVTFLVHGEAPEGRLAAILPLSEEQLARKREAILCHSAQLFLSRKRFLSRARAGEPFYLPEHDRVRVDSEMRRRVARARHRMRVLLGKR